MIAGCIRTQCTPYYEVLLSCKGIGNDHLYTLLKIMTMMQEKKRHTVALMITFQFLLWNSFNIIDNGYVLIKFTM